MADRLGLLLGRTYVRYGLASVIALGGDVGLFILFLSLGLNAALSAVLGYIAGIFVHWLVSSRLVFADGMAPRGAERTRQKALFIGSALVGLSLTTMIVALGGMFGLMPLLAKVIAIGVSFQVTYLIRKVIVFA